MLTPNIVPDFTGLNAAVVGDLIADHYLFAEPGRLSREAPVMVMRRRSEEVRPGGTANVARNVWSLGTPTKVIGAVGRDRNGREVVGVLEGEGIDVEGISSVSGWTTPTKTRILGSEERRTPQQVLRIDHEPEGPIPAEVCRELAERVRALRGKVDVLLLSDYSYGAVGPEVAEAALELKASGVTVILDPRRTLDCFRGVTAMTPNITELAELVGRPTQVLRDPNELARAAQEALARLEPDFLLVTLGNHGMALFSRDLPDEGLTVEASGSEEVIDVSGAGDTAVAAFGLSLAAGLEPARAMRLANAAAGVVVMENGTAVCKLSKLRSALPLAPKPGGLEPARP